VVPEQIVGRLRHLHSGEKSMKISHESIYRAIYVTR
jgi:IS30 family transposase